MARNRRWSCNRRWNWNRCRSWSWGCSNLWDRFWHLPLVKRNRLGKFALQRFILQFHRKSFDALKNLIIIINYRGRLIYLFCFLWLWFLLRFWRCRLGYKRLRRLWCLGYNLYRLGCNLLRLRCCCNLLRLRFNCLYRLGCFLYRLRFCLYGLGLRFGSCCLHWFGNYFLGRVLLNWLCNSLFLLFDSDHLLLILRLFVVGYLHSSFSA